MAKGDLTIEYGFKECSKCEYFLRCEECAHSKTATNDLMTFIRNGTAREILNKIFKTLFSGPTMNSNGDWGFDHEIVLDLLNELAKHYGVEVE